MIKWLAWLIVVSSGLMAIPFLLLMVVNSIVALFSLNWRIGLVAMPDGLIAVGLAAVALGTNWLFLEEKPNRFRTAVKVLNGQQLTDEEIAVLVRARREDISRQVREEMESRQRLIDKILDGEPLTAEELSILEKRNPASPS